jgi:hypothetical protein
MTSNVAESCTGLVSVSQIRVRGTMLWFNAAKDLGALTTEDGERIELSGAAFLPDERLLGRCAGMVVEFDWCDGMVSGVELVEEVSPRRARLRRRR